MHCPFLPLTSVHEFFYFYFLVTLANTNTPLKESLPAWSKHCHVHEWVWYNQISWWQCSHPIQILGETWGDSILSRKSRLISRNIRIGLSSHFISGQPNIPYMRASLDMLGEVGFAHMAYSGGLIWTKFQVLTRHSRLYRTVSLGLQPTMAIDPVTRGCPHSDPCFWVILISQYHIKILVIEKHFFFISLQSTFIDKTSILPGTK